MLEKYKRKLLSYLNKEHFDYTQGSVDPFEYHSYYHIYAKLFGVMDCEKIEWWMYISPVGVAISGLMAATLCTITVVHSAKKFEIHVMTECGTYLIVMGYKLVIISCVFKNKEQYHRLMRALRYDFEYICTKGQKYRDRYFENHKFTFKACIVSGLFTASVGTGMSIFACLALVFYYLNADTNIGNLGVRPLPFPFWLFDYDLHATPIYEILFTLSIIFTFCHTYSYIFMVLSQVIWVREITCKADVVIWRIQDLLVDVQLARNKAESEYNDQLIRHRMRDIISMHHSMFELMLDFASVYKKCLLFEQKMAGPVICLTAYCFSEKLDEGEFQGILLILCGAVFGVLLIPSLLCTFLLEKVQSVSDACWDVPFWNAGPVLRPYLVLIMQRSMRPLPLVEPGFEDISLKTYANIISRAYSCFNMLRQAKF